jgi:ABC-type glycerol-3-phosphate transport system substrate-binding protein
MSGRKLILGLLMTVIIFSGCVPQKEAGNKAGVITVWHWMTDRDPAFRELAKRYEAKTGIKVNFELYAPSDVYSQKVRAAAQGENLPDIFGILGEKRDFASFIKAGHVQNLYDYLAADNAKWLNRFYTKALALNEFGPGNIYGVSQGFYGVPIDIMTIQVLYNKKLLKELGVLPPKTFQELLDIGKKIKAAKMQGLVSGWGETWMINSFTNDYAFNIMGADKVLATIRGEIPYTDPDWIRVLTLFKEMKESGVLAGGLVTMINKNAEQLFANGRAVFAFNGSWCVNVYKGMNPDLSYGVMLPPKASVKYPMVIQGGAGSSFMVNARSGNKEEAVKFLEWLTDKEQQVYLSESTNNLPANKESVRSLSEVMEQFAGGMDSATHPNVWAVAEFPTVSEALGKGIQSIIIGEKTPEQVAVDVQKIKVRELARKK